MATTDPLGNCPCCGAHPAEWRDRPDTKETRMHNEADEMLRLLMMGRSATTPCGYWKGQRCRTPGQCFDHGRVELLRRLGVPSRKVRL